MPNSNIRGISISGTMDFIFTSISSLVFNPLRLFYHTGGYFRAKRYGCIVLMSSRCLCNVGW
jgi:hypothetical protein